MEWIAINDRKPDAPGRYLVYHWYSDGIYISYWDGKEWEYNRIMSHWALLPPKPQNATSVYLNIGGAILVDTDGDGKIMG